MDVSPSSDPADPMHSDCPGRDLFELITSRWPLLILWSLRGGPQRFYEVRNAVEGISERVLSEVLKKLCRHADHPPCPAERPAEGQLCPDRPGRGIAGRHGRADRLDRARTGKRPGGQAPL